MQNMPEEIRGVVVFRPGERTVDQTNADTFLAPLSARLKDASRLALDLSSINFLSSAGLGAIVMLVREARSAGKQVALCCPTQTVKALFKMVRLENIARVHESLEAALTELSGPA